MDRVGDIIRIHDDCKSQVSSSYIGVYGDTVDSDFRITRINLDLKAHNGQTEAVSLKTSERVTLYDDEYYNITRELKLKKLKNIINNAKNR